MSDPSASKVISPATSKVKLPEVLLTSPLRAILPLTPRLSVYKVSPST